MRSLLKWNAMTGEDDFKKLQKLRLEKQQWIE